MSADLEASIETVRYRLGQGVSLEDVVAELHADGLTIIQSIRVVREASDLTLGQAKEVVSSHPVWAEVVRAAEPLHEDLEEVFRQNE